MHRLVPVALVVAAALSALSAAAGPLVENGHSAWVIYRAPDAVPSVKLAAEEIQRVLRLSTGAELPIVDAPASPIICLGDNAASRAAGLSSEGLVADAFIIRTVGGNLYIVGKEHPDDQPPHVGWTSRGTLYGAYDFLERVVGVRWLMPGDVGEDIPAHPTLELPELDLQDAPDFPIRLVTDIQEGLRASIPDRRMVDRWLNRMKMPCKQFDGYKLVWGHAWDQYVTEEQLAQHPEWRALVETGERYVPAKHAAVKYCTTDPALIQAFADGVMKWLEDHPERLGASISPSDGGVFCRCERCLPYIENDPYGWASQTRLILNFYNAVATIVAQKFPDRPLAGYIYYNYTYPPAETVTMHPNVWLVLFPLRYYGWGLAKPPYAAEFRGLLERWQQFTRNVVYGDYSVWMRSFNGAIVPPARDILKLEVPTAGDLGYQGVSMVGIGAWGYGGPTNYVYARQTWDHTIDVDATLDEWYQRAYGPGWRSMRELFEMVEARLVEWKRREKLDYFGYQYEVNYELIEFVHKPILADIERLYRAALAAAETDAQRQRIEMLGANLIQLHHDMRQAGMIADNEDSIFYRTEEQYQQFLAEQRNSIALDPALGRYPIWHGEWSG